MAKSIRLFSPETGYWYRRYPEARLRNGRVYWVRTKPGGGAKYLHVDLWEKYNGPVPDDYHIHHIDHDPLNNDIGNLTCLSPSEHMAHHSATLSDERIAQRAAHMDAIRPLAAAWHQSPEGREWHKVLGRLSWDVRKPTAAVCEHCSAEYETLIPHQSRFCSNGCKTKARFHSGVDNITKPCLRCGKLRTGNRYQLKDFCNKWCRRDYEAAVP